MGRRSMIDKQYVYDLWNAGFNAKEIASRTGYAIQTVYAIRYSYIGRIKPKENNPVRQAVIDLYNQGKKQCDIAKEIGVSRQRVSQIVIEERL